jgi:hypothetical protein
MLVSPNYTNSVWGVVPAAFSLGAPGMFPGGEGNMSTLIDKNYSLSVGAIVNVDSVIGHYVTTGISYSLSSGRSVSITAGESSTEHVGKTKNVEVGESIVISCGGTRLTMKANGEIEITGRSIRLNASDDITLKAGRINLN